jgi:hypothetical protein
MGTICECSSRARSRELEKHRGASHWLVVLVLNLNNWFASSAFTNIVQSTLSFKDVNEKAMPRIQLKSP